MFCIHCGAKLADSSKFCPLCGTPAAQTPPAAQPAATAQPVMQAAQPVYGAPVYSYPVYVMPAPVSGQPASQAAPQAASAAVQAAAPTNPYAAPVSAAGGIPAYKQPTPPAAAPQPEEEDAELLVDEPVTEDTTKALSVWQTIVSLLALFCLPIGNIIFACVWGFRLNEHPQRRTLARAALPFIAIGLIALFCGLLWLVTNMSQISISFR